MATCKLCSANVTKDLVTCDGICGNTFHASCLKRGSRSSSVHAATCPECSEIKPCHILRLIRGLFDSFSADQSVIAEKISSISANWAALQLFSEDFHAMNFKLEKLVEVCTSFDSTSGSLLERSHDLRCKVNSLSDALEDVRSSICHRDLGARSSDGSTPVLPIIEDIRRGIKQVRGELVSWSAVVTSSAEMIGSIASDVRNLSSANSSLPSATAPDMSPASLSLAVNSGNSAALRTNSIRNTFSDDSTVAASPIFTQPTSSNPPAATSVCVQTSPPASPQTYTSVSSIVRFGTSWTETEWAMRLNRLNAKQSSSSSFSSNGHTPFLLKGAPLSANDSWIRSFFTRNFAFTPTSCQKIHSSELTSSSNFKIFIPNKYIWLISNPTSRLITFGGIEISKWTNKSVKFSPKLINFSHYSKHFTKTNTNKPKPINISPKHSNNCTIPDSIIPKPSTTPKTNTRRPTSEPKTKSNSLPSRLNPNTRNKYISNPHLSTSHHSPAMPTHFPKSSALNSNWQLKMGVFPNFNLCTPVKYPNFSYSHTLNPSVPSTPKPLNSFSSTAHTSTTPNPPEHPPHSDPPISSIYSPKPKLSVSTTAAPSDTTSADPPSPPTKTPSPDLPSFIDPLVPPVVKLTMRSADSIDGRYLLSRLRDHRIYENVRLFLAYLHDKPDSVCIDGKTRTNILTLIHQEGLPTDPTALRQLFTKYHDALNIPSLKVAEDLSTYASYINSRRISHLQKSRSDFRNYFRS